MKALLLTGSGRPPCRLSVEEGELRGADGLMNEEEPLDTIEPKSTSPLFPDHLTATNPQSTLPSDPDDDDDDDDDNTAISRSSSSTISDDSGVEGGSGGEGEGVKKELATPTPIQDGITNYPIQVT